MDFIRVTDAMKARTNEDSYLCVFKEISKTSFEDMPALFNSTSSGSRQKKL